MSITGREGGWIQSISFSSLNSECRDTDVVDSAIIRQWKSVSVFPKFDIGNEALCNMPPNNGDEHTRRPWQEVVARKRRERDHALRPFATVDDIELKQRPIKLDAINLRSALKDQRQNVLTDENEIEILLERIKLGRLSAHDLVEAYIRRCECYTV